MGVITGEDRWLTRSTGDGTGGRKAAAGLEPWGAVGSNLAWWRLGTQGAALWEYLQLKAQAVASGEAQQVQQALPCHQLNQQQRKEADLQQQRLWGWG